MKGFIYWTADLKSSRPWSSQFWTQSKQLRTEAWKSQDFNGVWTRDLAIPVRRSNQLTYEATDVGSWSSVSSNEPVKNGFITSHPFFMHCDFLVCLMSIDILFLCFRLFLWNWWRLRENEAAYCGKIWQSKSSYCQMHCILLIWGLCTGLEIADDMSFKSNCYKWLLAYWLILIIVPVFRVTVL